MRCLYCGKELALLKRLRGGGDFCSDAHKHSYQEEYNRLALSRLLQAQKKGQKTTSPAAPNAPPPPNASVALEEPAPPLLEETASLPADAPVLERDLTAPPESAAGDLAAEEPSPEVVAEADSEALADDDASASAEPEPPEESDPVDTAGFLLENPTLAVWPEETPYFEPWLEPSAGPAMSEWALQNGAAFSLSTADLVSLDLRPGASSSNDHIFSSDLSPQAFTGAAPDRLFSALANAKKIVDKNRLPASGAIAIDIAPSAVASAADQSLVQAVGFESAVLVDDSQLLELSPTAIDFTAEDSDVVVLARSHFNGTNGAALAQAETELEIAAPSNDDSPRASLEALSRLHHELVEQEAARIEEPPTESAPAPMEAAAEVVEAMPVQVIMPVEAVTSQNPAPEPQTVKIKAEEPTPAREALKPTEAVRPKFTTELCDLSIRIFPPAKPALIAGEPFPSHIGPLMPHLKSLPLRPKVALAPGYVPPSNTPVLPEAKAPETKPPAAAATTVRAPSPSKPAPGGKPAARLTQPKRPTSPAGQVQPAAAKAPSPRVPASPKPVASPPVTVPEPVAAPANVKETTTKAPLAEKAPAADTGKPAADAGKPAADAAKLPADTGKPAADTGKPAADTGKPAQDQAKPRADLARPSADLAKKDNVPSFDIAQPASNSWLGSLKVKLGLAILILVLACAYFLGWGGKSHNPAGPNPAADGSGPSIIMGEGGWVEGWGGDPTGLHAGRQITIYRPSLKLSDYRLAFQASIDAKSVGWVFRASDPNNYYAMKLMTVSSGLSTKVALFKYLVANGKQTQVGRVPIDLAVHPDTVFDVRVDVRGPQFTTYIQGQQVDSWTDDQLKIGGAGFLNERDERGKVKSVSIRYLTSSGAK
jgi:hypothetical protein